ncbi:MAG: C-GCAxxG-C-C family protein [Synergistaceae bacterium]|jgi:C_GCAxxG_C_C family probable redox protein|nr:C-GCAxxG-C-C family protein [Synergistaceae bacterium]
MESVALKNAADKAGELAWKYEQQYGGCSQVVLAAIRENLGHIGDDVFQAATGLAGGLGRTGHACGALVGGVMALSCFRGRPYDDFPDSAGQRPPCLAMSKKLVRAFEEAYGSADCHGIHRKLLGRAYDLDNPEEFQQFIKDGGHDDKCTSVCANSARWVIGILNEEGLI